MKDLSAEAKAADTPVQIAAPTATPTDTRADADATAPRSPGQRTRGGHVERHEHSGIRHRRARAAGDCRLPHRALARRRQAQRLSPAMSARERLLHPAAWWLWGLGLATAASRTTNPMVLLLIIGVCILVVSERRDPSAPNPLMAFVVIGAMVVVFRLVMTVILGSRIRGECSSPSPDPPARMGILPADRWPGVAGEPALRPL